ncbi:MAG: hypothetical protein IJH18_01550 [Bacilli bacterium]|nr:hypothetical protein [Bacilli bacterium]
MENKVLVKLFVPYIESHYEVFLPVGKRIGDLVILLSKSLVEISNGYYDITNNERLYNRISGNAYDESQILKNTDIRNGTELIIM